MRASLAALIRRVSKVGGGYDVSFWGYADERYTTVKGILHQVYGGLKTTSSDMMTVYGISPTTCAIVHAHRPP